jgi:hypothetical protein
MADYLRQVNTFVGFLLLYSFSCATSSWQITCAGLAQPQSTPSLVVQLDIDIKTII